MISIFHLNLASIFKIMNKYKCLVFALDQSTLAKKKK